MQHLVLYRTIWDHLDFGTTLDHIGQHHLRSYGTMSIVHCRATFESSLVVIGLLCWHIFCYKWQLWYENLVRGSWTCVPESTWEIVYISNIQLYNVRGVVWISLPDFFPQHCHLDSDHVLHSSSARKTVLTNGNVEENVTTFIKAYCTPTFPPLTNLITFER